MIAARSAARRRVRRAAVAVLLSTALLPAFAADPVGWGGDVNTGSGPKLVARARPHLLAIVEADEDARPALIAEFAKSHAYPLIEAVKRFRNPELMPLFVALLDHENWKVQHRALFALEGYRDGSVLGRAWEIANTAEEARLREKAVITCLELWDDASKGERPAGLDGKIVARLSAEPDRHVRSCLTALRAHVAGKLECKRVHIEHVHEEPDGLLWTPFLASMSEAKNVAPGYKAKSGMQSGGGKASKLGAAPFWTTPLLGFGDEEVKGTSLQPFANLRGGGKIYHTGLDIGACLDGAGYYAAADGVVRLVSTGTDMGTMLVTQHSTDGKALVNAVYMHGGDVVFVKAGEKVRAGQLLGSMGMGYSIENGGHFAHLHYGLYPGSFSTTHNYGYRSVSAGLADWTDPARFLPLWIERTRPLVPEFEGLGTAATTVMALARGGALERAWSAAEKLSGDDGERVREALAAVPAEIERRANAERARGYPRLALAVLEDSAKSAKGIPGIERLPKLASEWKADAVFDGALAADAAVSKLEQKEIKLLAAKGGREKARVAWRKLLEEHGGTPVRARIERKLELLGE
jgi:murein DD-endopeptidase MepM/ murein hydrolase activator NlpD